MRPFNSTRARAIAAALGLAVSLAPAVRAGSTHARATRDQRDADRALSSEGYADRVFELLNQERRRHGLRQLRSDACSQGYATRWSAELARSERLRHQSMRPMMKTCRAKRVAENVALGTVGPERIMKTWMDSPGHRANILDPRLDWVGVAAARSESGRWYVVQDFLGN